MSCSLHENNILKFVAPEVVKSYKSLTSLIYILFRAIALSGDIFVFAAAVWQYSVIAPGSMADSIGGLGWCTWKAVFKDTGEDCCDGGNETLA